MPAPRCKARRTSTSAAFPRCPSPTPTAVVTINGTVIAGLYYDLDVTIPNCKDSSGYYCSQLKLTASDGTVLGNALLTAQNGMPLTIAAGASSDVATYNAAFDPGTLSSVLPSGVASGTVGAWTFGPLVASAGNVNLNATSFAGTGSITANGAPNITVKNLSPDYLVMNSVLIPDLAGGKVNYTGTAASSPTLTVNPHNSTGTPAIDIENDYNISDTPNGPALYLLGNSTSQVTGVLNLGGVITIVNKLGSYGATEAVEGFQVNIAIPNGFAVINIPDPPGIEPVGGNPFSEWVNYIIWPGNNPTLNQGFNTNVAAAYLANAAYNAKAPIRTPPPSPSIWSATSMTRARPEAAPSSTAIAASSSSAIAAPTRRRASARGPTNSRGLSATTTANTPWCRSKRSPRTRIQA